jgi:hypothetical protein
VGGSSNSYITGCISNVNVTAKNYVGGIAGSVQANRAAATVNRDNVNNGEINGASYVGGIYGSLVVQDGKNNDTVTLTGHANNGSINGSGENIGGLFGNISGKYSYISYTGYYAKVKITGCTNSGEISGTDNVGGIAGNASVQVGEITLSTNTGAVSGNMYVGGYAGKADGATMKALTNTVYVTGKAYVGGIAGTAGMVDGCTNFRFLLQVVLPLSAPIMVVIALYYGVGRWNDYFSAMIYLNNQKLWPMQLVLREILLQNNFSSTNVMFTDFNQAERQMEISGMKYAVIVFATLPIMIIYPMCQRFFAKGVMVGSLKG